MNTYLNALARYYAAQPESAAADDAVRAVSPDVIFGPLSQSAADSAVTAADGAATAVTETAAATATTVFTSTTVFHIATVLLLVCYVTVMYRHPELLKALREYIFSPASGSERHSSDNRNDPLRGFSWGSLLLGTLFFCTAAVRTAEAAMPAAYAVTPSVLPSALCMLAVPLSAALFFAVTAYQRALLMAAGAVTVSQPLSAALLRIKSVYFRLSATILTPLLLLWAVSPAAAGRPFGIIMAIAVVFIAVAFLRETFLLFISKKLSIYHWFLYLCTVEAFPVSIVVLVAAGR